MPNEEYSVFIQVVVPEEEGSREETITVECQIITAEAWALLSLRNKLRDGKLPDKEAGIFLSGQPWFRQVNSLGPDDTLPLLSVKEFVCPSPNSVSPTLLILSYCLNGNNLGLTLIRRAQRRLSSDPDS